MALLFSLNYFFRDYSKNYHVGRDLIHAMDKVEFCEEERALQDNIKRYSKGIYLLILLNYYFEYMGILTAIEEGRE